jgi:predicted house-cleaning noncanonical NTP pyrophosphatase (MazG superfamily)
MEEMYEACVLLKNSKHHRATEVKEFDREMYLEELSDAMHYLIEIVIASGFSMSEFKKVFLEKGEKNKNRIKLGY